MFDGERGKISIRFTQLVQAATRIGGMRLGASEQVFVKPDGGSQA